MALAQPTPLPFPEAETTEPVFQPKQQELMVEFAEQFTQLQGKFVFCMNEAELSESLNVLVSQRQWRKIYCSEEKIQNLIARDLLTPDISSCDASITSCEALIARTGSVVLSSSQQGRLSSVYAPVHICIAFAHQLVYDVKDGLTHVSKKYLNNMPSLITFATGPSRTADIEKTLVVGVHGPREVFCFVLDDQN